MRDPNRLIWLGLALLLLQGCGQSGALVLPNAQNEDRRAQYLLYQQSKKAKNTVQNQALTADSAASAVQTQP